MIDKAKIRKAHKVYTNEDGVQMCEMEFSKYLEMEQALTPPTADEVCKALSDYYGKEVKVDKRYNNTTFVCDGRNIAWVDNNGSVQINQPKPPHLITLIGRFYEGEIK
jgi:hypothetical protein